MVQRRYQECWTCKRQTFDKRFNRCEGCEADIAAERERDAFGPKLSLDAGAVAIEAEPYLQRTAHAGPNMTRRQLFATVLLGSALGTVTVLVAANTVIALLSDWWQ